MTSGALYILLVALPQFAGHSTVSTGPLKTLNLRSRPRRTTKYISGMTLAVVSINLDLVGNIFSWPNRNCLA